MPQLTFTLNGRAWRGEVPEGASLLELVRERAGLTGPKLGCGEGQCGSCTVLVDGKALPACITPATSTEGREVTTIEGVAVDGRLHPVQQAFVDAQAFQCGFCTPGMILGTMALLDRNRSPTDDDIRDALNGHLCRCGTYPRIVDAVRRAVAALAAGVHRG
jgi:aerobic-type carbon monoxide dehydrogenase small subunit (CoxS/CutS family)